jgi:hypothetical protein
MGVERIVTIVLLIGMVVGLGARIQRLRQHEGPLIRPAWTYLFPLAIAIAAIALGVATRSVLGCVVAIAFGLFGLVVWFQRPAPTSDLGACKSPNRR